MKQSVHILFFALFLGITGSAWAEQDGRLSESNQAMITAKRQKIENEIAQLKDHPWAGQYYHGDGFGTNVTLTLSPENGFTVTWFGCLGLYDQNHGTVDWDKSRIKLSFAFDMAKGYTGRYASEYRPIRWGERLYLIPTDEIIEFCNAINSRDEPRMGIHGFFLLRGGGEKKEAKGKPELPEEFMPYLLDEPVKAKIVSVNKDIQESRLGKVVTVFVDKGKKDGLLPGMELYVVKSNSGTIYKTIKLTQVDETQSEGKFIYESPYETSSRKTPKPTKGWQLSTCPSWRR